MKVYITYFRYDRDENYTIYHIDLNKKSSIKHYKETDLPEFLGYGPDDVSILVLQEVEMTKTELTELIHLYGKGEDYDRELINFMIPIFENDEGCIFYDGCETNYDFGKFYCLNYKDMTEEEFEDGELEVFEELDKLEEKDPEKYKSIFNSFVKQHYGY